METIDDLIKGLHDLKKSVSASFHYDGRYIGKSLEAVLTYISIWKRLRPDITLNDMLKEKKILTLQLYQLALEKWNVVKPITDEEWFELFSFPFKKAA